MLSVMLGDNPIAVNKYINIFRSVRLWLQQCGVTTVLCSWRWANDCPKYVEL